MIDTHAHLYAEEFDSDRNEMIQRAKDAGITKIILPNVDSKTIDDMLSLENQFPDFCYVAMGLHPTSVKEDFQQELEIHRNWLQKRKFTAIGEIGLDLYWDKTFLKEQIYCFQKQLDWSLEYQLPVIIHVRDSMAETIEVLSDYKGKGLRGIFHSFTGNTHDAEMIAQTGDFYLGINGIVTFKNSGLAENLQEISINRLVLETDAPYLTPVPFRGKRNESSYLRIIAEKISNIYGFQYEYVIKKTTENACCIFGLPVET
jgi:TatD DNase family protein